jgi:flagellar biosynthesis GTPase FlhF
MQIQRVNGNNLRDALERAARMHGESALVVARDVGQDGAVTVSVLPRSETAVERFARFGFTAEAERESPTERLERGRDPAMFDVRERLRAAGFTREFENVLVARAETLREKGVHPIDAAAALLGHRVPIAAGPKAQERTALVGLVGPEADSTRSVALSLGRRLVDAGRRATVVSIEPHPTAEGDALEDEVLGAGIGMLRGDDGARIGARLAQLGAGHVAIVCTGGRVSFDGRQLLRLGMVLRDDDQLGSLTNYLVVQASRPRTTLDRAWRGFERFKPRGLVGTACDRTAEFGPLFEFATDRQLGLVFLAGRPGDPRQLVRPTPKLVADLVLGGRSPWS